MKAYREEPEPVFKPIHLIIETEEEATILWHRLNAARSTTLEDYYKASNRNDYEGGLPLGEIVSIFHALNEVFAP